MSIGVAESGASIITEDEELSFDALHALVNREVLVVRVSKFIDGAACRQISLGLQKAGYDDYVNAPTVGRIGMSFFETTGSADLREHYFRTAIPNIQLLRDACAPYQCPIDVFRCVLDEVWPQGAQLQMLGGRKMFAGLSRNMRPGAPLLAHHDIFARLAPENVEATGLLGQFAVNVYADVPEQGGELLMWREEISDDEFLRRRGDKYGMDLEPLGAPDIVIKPMVGDLILFNARKLHAVAPGKGSDRLTLSCFVGFRGDKQPLTFWS